MSLFVWPDVYLYCLPALFSYKERKLRKVSTIFLTFINNDPHNFCGSHTSSIVDPCIILILRWYTNSNVLSAGESLNGVFFPICSAHLTPGWQPQANKMDPSVYDLHINKELATLQDVSSTDNNFTDCLVITTDWHEKGNKTKIYEFEISLIAGCNPGTHSIWLEI